MPLVAGMRSLAGFQLSDLIAGTRTSTPAIYHQAGIPIESALELATNDIALFGKASVRFDVRRSGDEAAAATVDARLSETDFERQQIARASLPTEGLAPGEDIVSATVGIDGKSGRVSRNLVLLAPAIVAPPPTAAAPRPEPTAVTAPREAAAAADSGLRALMETVGAYVQAYGEKAAAIVALEKYTQYLDAGERPHRLTADFALVRTANAGWTGFRDVIEVNGKHIPDRRDRLFKLLQTSAQPLEDAGRLAAESARFNVGPVIRNFNVPTTALLFFTSGNLRRFTFVRRGTKNIDGIETWEVSFRETATPTLVTTRAGKNVPAQGTLWISPEDGAVIRYRLQLRGFADALALPGAKGPGAPVEGGAGSPASTPAAAPSGGTAASPPGGTAGAGGNSGGAQASSPGGGTSRPDRGNRVDVSDAFISVLESHADIEVTYQRHVQIGMWLPVRMSEEYAGPLMRLNQPPIQGMSRASATYTDYKVFETGARIVAPAK